MTPKGFGSHIANEIAMEKQSVGVLGTLASLGRAGGKAMETMGSAPTLRRLGQGAIDYGIPLGVGAATASGVSEGGSNPLTAGFFGAGAGMLARPTTWRNAWRNSGDIAAANPKMPRLDAFINELTPAVMAKLKFVAGGAASEGVGQALPIIRNLARTTEGAADTTAASAKLMENLKDKLPSAVETFDQGGRALRESSEQVAGAMNKATDTLGTQAGRIGSSMQGMADTAEKTRQSVTGGANSLIDNVKKYAPYAAAGGAGLAGLWALHKVLSRKKRPAPSGPRRQSVRAVFKKPGVYNVDIGDTQDDESQLALKAAGAAYRETGRQLALAIYGT